jgi:hypothetical protein
MNFNSQKFKFLVLALTSCASHQTTRTTASVPEINRASINTKVSNALGIPFFFTLPETSFLPLPQSILDNDHLFVFRHPDAGADPRKFLGLRLFGADEQVSREVISEEIVKAGLVQTGDILLSFRNQWAGTGPYPHLQMGVSHSGIAYVKDGVLHNLDMPLDPQHNGPDYRSRINSNHYREASLIHIVRPRGFGPSQRVILQKWIDRIVDQAPRSAKVLAFNAEYGKPNAKPGKQNQFIKDLGRIALGMAPETTPRISMYCSEFVWVLLALRNCDPDLTKQDFAGNEYPKCIQPLIEPAPLLGNAASGSENGIAGLADGPLLILNSLKMSQSEKIKKIDVVFSQNANLENMSAGHRAAAAAIPKILLDSLKEYYKIAGLDPIRTPMIRTTINAATPPNYSPPMFLVNTLLERRNPNRVFDYVGTLAIEEIKPFAEEIK